MFLPSGAALPRRRGGGCEVDGPRWRSAYATPPDPNARRGTIGRQGGQPPRRLEDTSPRVGAWRRLQARGSTRLPAPPPRIGYVSGEARPLSRAVKTSRTKPIIQKSSHLVNRSRPQIRRSSHRNNRSRSSAGVGHREWSSREQTCGNALPLCESDRRRIPPAAASDTISALAFPATPDRRSPVLVQHQLVQAAQQSSPPRCRRRGPSGVLHVAYLPCMEAARGAVQRTQPQVPSEVRTCIGANRPTAVKRRGRARLPRRGRPRCRRRAAKIFAHAGDAAVRWTTPAGRGGRPPQLAPGPGA